MANVIINYVAVLVSAAAAMGVGFLWYSPVLFAKPWTRLMGYTKESMEAAKKEMGKTYSISFVGALVMAYVAAHFVSYVGARTLSQGAQLGFWAWLGFVAPVQMTDVLFGGKKWKLFAINTGYQLASLVIMGAILAVWA